MYDAVRMETVDCLFGQIQNALSCMIAQKGAMFCEEGGLILYGNEFQCNIETDCARYEVAVKSDKMAGLMKIILQT